jgi:hypothetical protein
MSNVIVPSAFSTKSITVSAPRSLQSGAKQAYLNYGREKLIMQTATAMSVPFGLNCADKFGPPEYSVDLSFRGHEQRPEIKQFMDVMTQIDEFMLEQGVKNSKAWFKADLSRDVIKAFYTPCVKYSKDKEGNVLSYPPNIKLKLRKNNGEFEAKFYDVNGTPHKDVPVEDLLVKGVQVTAIMECGGVWFAGSKFGLTWRAKQIAVHELPKKMGDFAFTGLKAATAVNEEDEEKEVDDDAVFHVQNTVSATSAVAAMMPQAQAQVQVQVQLQPEAMKVDSPFLAAQVPPSVDDEEGDDVEPVPAPTKTVVKKKIVVKK